MVRPHFGPLHFKPSRSYTDRPSFVSSEEHYRPNSNSQREIPEYPGRNPSSRRESRGRGRPPFAKRGPIMGERRAPPFNQWRSPNQDSFKPYPQTDQTEPHHSHRKPSPSSLARPPQSQLHRSSSRSPVQRSPGHRGPPFHGQSSVHRSPSPQHYHTHPADRRPGSAPHYKGSFRTPSKRQSGYPHEEQLKQDPRGHYSTRGRQYGHSTHGVKHWNGAGTSSHQYRGQHGPSGSQRKPWELHGRTSYPERYKCKAALQAGWSTEQDSRRQLGDVASEGNRSRRAEKAQGGHFDVPPNRSSSWKGSPSSSSSSSFHKPPQVPFPRKRRTPDFNPVPPGPLLEHGPKYHRRERPHLPSVSRGFSGRPMSLKDKRHFLKGRQMSAESVMRLRAPPLKPNPQVGKSTRSSILAMRMKRFQSNSLPLRKIELRKTKLHQSPPKSDSNTSTSSRDFDTMKEQVKSHRSLSTRSSSPIDKHLVSDLVVVSHWQAAPSSSSKGCSSPRDRSPKLKTERNYSSDVPLNNRFQKFQDFKTACDYHRGGFPNQKPFRSVNITQDSHRLGRPFRKLGPGPTQMQKFGGPRRTAPESTGNFRKPLMESVVPRPYPQQKPVFRKSQSIMSKYRNMQAMRNRVPYNREPNQQRW
ncbi:serine/arginine repetitive matrix protein 1 [Lampris incognitus]|uniref:serine/arginine repetitive matrix protein 1 n=1 Tax=Lampris incognitus TaxID=2546036 RepID=UPI0024B5D8F7|nr:serine/arginine repetitive matrix protein 1 [Lampris incognitus]